MDLVLALFGIPILAIIGGITGWRLSKKHRKILRLAASFLGVIVFPVLFVMIMSFIFPNKAQTENKRIYKNLSTLHAKLICDNGDPGQGPDNTTPWYTAYYYIDGTSTAVQKIEGFHGR